MNPSKLTAYRESAKEAKDVRLMPSSEYIPTLATAVADLCAEVERLQARVQELGGSVDYLKL